MLGLKKLKSKKEAMRKKLFITLSPLALLAGVALAQDAKAVLKSATKPMGDVKSIQYSGTGHLYGLAPDECCPRWNAGITGFNNRAYEQRRLV
jgi:hypothetical protein